MTRKGLVRDAALPAGVAVVAVTEMALARWAGWQAGALLEVLACALLVLRRPYALLVAPAAALLLLVIPWFGPQLNEPSVPILILAVACYSLGRWLADLRGVVGLAVIAAGMAVDYFTVDLRPRSVSDAFFVVALVAPPYVLGRVVRRLAVQGEQLRERSAWLREEAVRAERDRIARDLHDVVAHSVSAMVVQTAAAQDLIRTDPDRAALALDSVASTGRRALAETGRLLHVIRDEAGELGLEPAPGLHDLDDLVERFRTSGLRVEVFREGTPAPLPVGVDVSAYRIIEEALTNALRYAADRAVALSLAWEPRDLVIATDNAVGGQSGQGSGLGLIGVAERAALVGGRLDHAGVEDGRFRVCARLPLAGAGEMA